MFEVLNISVLVFLILFEPVVHISIIIVVELIIGDFSLPPVFVVKIHCYNIIIIGQIICIRFAINS